MSKERTTHVSWARALVAFAILFGIYQSAEGIGDRILHSFPAQASIMVMTVVAAWPIGRWLLRSNGYDAFGLAWRPAVIGWLALGLLIAFASKAAALVMGNWVGAYMPGATQISALSIAALPLILVSTFIPSIAEDILTRGIWMRAGPPCLRGLAFVLVTSVIYVLNHIFVLADGPAQWVRLFCFGVAYATAVIASRSLWGAVGLHWGWNLANALADRLVSLDADQAIAPWISALAHLVMALVYARIAIAIRRRPSHSADA